MDTRDALFDAFFARDEESILCQQLPFSCSVNGLVVWQSNKGEGVSCRTFPVHQEDFARRASSCSGNEETRLVKSRDTLLHIRDASCFQGLS